MTRRMLAFVIGAALFLDACSTAPMNKPLNQATLNNGPGDISIGGYRSKALPDGDTSDQLLVLLASSGGGKRSAAFSYGVLRGLRDFKIPVKVANAAFSTNSIPTPRSPAGAFPPPTTVSIGIASSRISSGTS